MSIRHGVAGGAGAAAAGEPDPLPRGATPGILPSALRASLRLFKIAPDDFVTLNSPWRGAITPGRQGRRIGVQPDGAVPSVPERRAAMASPQYGAGCMLIGLLGVGAEYGILMPYSHVLESKAEGQGRPSGCNRTSIAATFD
jgi:hypothetical protein